MMVKGVVRGGPRGVMVKGGGEGRAERGDDEGGGEGRAERGDGEGGWECVSHLFCPLVPFLPSVYYRTYPRSHYDDSRVNRKRQRRVIIQRNTSPGRLSNRELGSSSESLRTTESDQALQVLADLAVAAGKPPTWGY